MAIIKLILITIFVRFDVVQLGHDWLICIMASDLPKYMRDVLGFPVYDVGLYSSLPFLLMWAVSGIVGFLSDFLINANYITITQARKIFTGLASMLPAIFILIASYAECNRELVILSFILYVKIPKSISLDVF